MVVYYAVMFFIIGIILGSFYNVVGYRLPKGESLLFPPSHCPNCNHRLTPLELIPIFSYILQKGKCKNCKQKIALFYPIFECSCGILFMISYLIFGLTWELLIVLTFISMLIIIVLSDCYYMIIPDSVLVVTSLFIILEIFFIKGTHATVVSILSGIGSFMIMYLLKKLGDFIFKRESMGGGDIKLMFVFGLTLGFPTAILTIFVGSIIGLPISLFIMHSERGVEIPFGPYLSAGAVILLFTQFHISQFLDFIKLYS